MRAATRERILEATIRSLSVHGYAKTTARSIAAIGGFAPGVLYYHFTDLDEVMVATAVYTSSAREAVYRSEMAGVTSAVTLVEKLRTLYPDDLRSGHIETIQELISAARPGSQLADALTDATRRWEELAEEVLRHLLRGKPLTKLVNPAVLARTAVAYYLGMQTLTNLDGDAGRPEAAFRQAARLAAAFDKLPSRRSGSAKRALS